MYRHPPPIFALPIFFMRAACRGDAAQPARVRADLEHHAQVVERVARGHRESQANAANEIARLVTVKDDGVHLAGLEGQRAPARLKVNDLRSGDCNLVPVQ